MNIRFHLKDGRAASSAIRLTITNDGRVYRKAIGIAIDPRQWRASAQCPNYTTNAAVSKRLREIYTRLLQELDDYSTPAQIERAMASACDEGKVHLPSFQEYFDEWSLRPCSVQRQRKNVRNIVSRLMGLNDGWNDITLPWLHSLCDKVDAAGYSANMKAGIIAKVRTVCSEGFERGYHTNEEFRKFHKHYEPAEAVWLTDAEVELLWSAELGEHLAKVRDLFLLGVYTASRFSDYSRLDGTMVEEGFLRFVQQKTRDEVVIPCSPRVAAILERNGGHAPKMCQQVFNRDVKEVCRLAGIDEPVTIGTTRGGVRELRTEPKWRLVTSHTARRTAATQMALSGTPMKSIAMITGHRHLASLETYLKMSKMENARLLKENKFFR